MRWRKRAINLWQMRSRKNPETRDSHQNKDHSWVEFGTISAVKPQELNRRKSVHKMMPPWISENQTNDEALIRAHCWEKSKRGVKSITKEWTLSRIPTRRWRSLLKISIESLRISGKIARKPWKKDSWNSPKEAMEDHLFQMLKAQKWLKSRCHMTNLYSMSASARPKTSRTSKSCALRQSSTSLQVRLTTLKALVSSSPITSTSQLETLTTALSWKDSRRLQKQSSSSPRTKQILWWQVWKCGVERTVSLSTACRGPTLMVSEAPLVNPLIRASTPMLSRVSLGPRLIRLKSLSKEACNRPKDGNSARREVTNGNGVFQTICAYLAIRRNTQMRVRLTWGQKKSSLDFMGGLTGSKTWCKSVL